MVIENVLSVKYCKSVILNIFFLLHQLHYNVGLPVGYLSPALNLIVQPFTNYADVCSRIIV